MIFTQLMVTNFGVYAGEHQFDLHPQVVRGHLMPLILFGGRNGSGKTTLLEAIRFCLYGRLALGSRIKRIDYEGYISQKIHREVNLNGSARTARVGLLFEHVHAGVKSTYDAVRAWTIDGKSFQETVSIFKDGRPFHDISPENFGDFLRDLIPPGVAELFFFDGEQIQTLADDDTESIALTSAFKGLLNLDLIQRLQTDLGIYLQRNTTPAQNKLKAEAEETKQAYDLLCEQLLEKKQDRASIVAQLEGARKRLEDSRQKLLQDGVTLVAQRTALEQRQKVLEQELEQAQDKLRDLAGDLLPFAVVPEWNKRLEHRLQAESNAEGASASAMFQKSQIKAIKNRLANREFQKSTAPNVSSKDWKEIADAVLQLLAPQESRKPVQQLHSHSAQQRGQLHRWIERTLTDIPNEVHKLGELIERLEEERSLNTVSLKQIPDPTLANPMIEAFHNLSTDVGALQERLGRISNELKQVEFQVMECQRKHKKALEKLVEEGGADDRVKNAAKVQLVLEEYHERVTAVKLGELEQQFLRYFNLLCQKKALVREVKIHPTTYTVTLFGDNRTILDKSLLSAGERQLYAMALLWALRSISGRQLPIVIDTPMGRLDSVHRSALVEHFFPNAAHQVIVFSTDTEMDRSTYEQLKPIMSHNYLLQHDVNQDRTTVEQSYFSGPTKGVAA